ncbi:PAS domain S-box protein [Spongiibacter nanhainus]|uniref:histidine kinase n=1 Tax=Spongiibacter nanhainus TaxID=2794344 RepID=A0A7T4QYC6_9GAMM|nr:PAS domain-containing sensor histidine kinase [Spongiibacter nanhainus]QQD16947.1 PAS domain S-box protein [Spongiibacter nanhainus]
MSFRDWAVVWSSREPGAPSPRRLRPWWGAVLLVLGMIALTVALPPYSLHSQQQHILQLQRQGEQLQKLDQLLAGGQAIEQVHHALDSGDIYGLTETQRHLSSAQSLLFDGDLQLLSEQFTSDLSDLLSLYLRIGTQGRDNAALPPLNLPSDRDIVVAALQGLESRHRLVTSQALTSAAHKQRWLVTHYVLSAVAAIGLVFSVLVLRDQSRRIRHQAAHIDNLEFHFERLLADLPGHWLALSLDGSILYASRSLADWLINSADELRGTRIDGLLPQLHREQFKRYLRNLDEGRRPDPMELYLEDSWGRSHPVSIEAGRFRMREGDALLVLLRDLSTEHELAHRCDRFRTRCDMLTRAVPGVMWEWDALRDEVRGNELLHQWLGTDGDSETVSPRKFFDQVHPKDRDRVSESFRNFLRSRGRDFSIEHRFNTTEGQCKEVACSAVVQRDDSGRVLAMVGVYTDITDRRQTEREHARLCRNLEDQVRLRTLQLEEAVTSAEAANRAKSTFLAAMGHEVRTPMNGVVGMTELLAKTPLDREQKMMLSTIQRSSVSLLGTMDNILDYAALESGRLQLDPQPTQLLELIEGVADDFAMTAARNGESFSLLITPSVPAQATVDPLRLRQSLRQLLDNAFKFAVYASPRGQVELLVDAERDGEGASERLVCRVRDNGIGVSTEIREKLFQPFFQADTSRARRFSGTGLGLALAARVAELMGGEVTLESSSGESTCFKLAVPLHESQARELPAPNSEGTPLYVLIENPRRRGEVESALRLHGIEAKYCLDATALANNLAGGRLSKEGVTRQVLIDESSRQVTELCQRYGAELIRLVPRPLAGTGGDVVAQQQVFVDPLLPSALARVVKQS